MARTRCESFVRVSALAGFVMRKGEQRFLVGWICGGTIYGERFDTYKADFDAVVNRQAAVRRRLQIESELKPLVTWLKAVAASGTFAQYHRVRQQLCDRLPWVWDNAPRMFYPGLWPKGIDTPKRMFENWTNLETDFNKVEAEANGLAASLMDRRDIDSTLVLKFKSTLLSIMNRAKAIADGLAELPDFFQPSALQAVCDYANEYDNPKKRNYEPAFMSLVCRKAGKEKVVVAMPTNYRLPDRDQLAALKANTERI